MELAAGLEPKLVRVGRKIWVSDEDVVKVASYQSKANRNYNDFLHLLCSCGNLFLDVEFGSLNRDLKNDVVCRDVEAEAVKAVKFLWKRKQTRKHLIFLGLGSGSIFHKTWGRDVEAVKFFWKREHL